MTSWRELGVEVLFTFSMPLFYAFLTTMMYGESSPTLLALCPPALPPIDLCSAAVCGDLATLGRRRPFRLTPYANLVGELKGTKVDPKTYWAEPGSKPVW